MDAIALFYDSAQRAQAQRPQLHQTLSLLPCQRQQVLQRAPHSCMNITASRGLAIQPPGLAPSAAPADHSGRHQHEAAPEPGAAERSLPDLRLCN